jgi:hypothetical protein
VHDRRVVFHLPGDEDVADREGFADVAGLGRLVWNLTASQPAESALERMQEAVGVSGHRLRFATLKSARFLAH